MINRNKTETYSSTRNERLDNTALLGGFLDLRNGQSALHNLKGLQTANSLLGQTVAHKLQNTTASNTGQNKLILQRSGDKLQAASSGVVPDNEEVARTSFGDLAVLAEQPEDLVEALRLGLSVSLQRGAVVGTELGRTEATGPGTNGVGSRSEELQALLRLSLAFLLHLSKVGPGNGNDEEQGLLGDLDTEVRAVTNDGRADIKERAGLLLRKPACICMSTNFLEKIYQSR